MLSSIVAPFLTLDAAAAALENEGFRCSAYDLVLLAAHGKVAICFPFKGFLTALDPARHDRKSLTDESFTFYYHGYLAIPQSVLSDCIAYGKDISGADVHYVAIPEADLDDFNLGLPPGLIRPGFLIQRISKVRSADCHPRSIEPATGPVTQPLGVLRKDLVAFARSFRNGQSDEPTPSASATNHSLPPAPETERNERDLSLDMPPSSKGRRTALCIMGALARHANLDVSEPYKAAAVIQAELSSMSISLTAEAIANWLKDVAGALDSRRS